VRPGPPGQCPCLRRQPVAEAVGEVAVLPAVPLCPGDLDSAAGATIGSSGRLSCGSPPRRGARVRLTPRRCCRSFPVVRSGGVTRLWRIGTPALNTGAVHLTSADLTPAVASTVVGGVGPEESCNRRRPSRRPRSRHSSSRRVPAVVPAPGNGSRPRVILRDGEWVRWDSAVDSPIRCRDRSSRSALPRRSGLVGRARGSSRNVGRPCHRWQDRTT
jgi:hypothetical protein